MFSSFIRLCHFLGLHPGVPINIYRPGRITGAVYSQMIPPNDSFNQYLNGIVKLGYAPVIENHFDLTPVDYTAKSIVAISKKSKFNNRCFHIVNPQVISHGALIDILNSLGYQIKTTYFKHWLNLLKADGSNPLTVYYPLLSQQGVDIMGYHSTFDMENTSLALRNEPHFDLPNVNSIATDLIQASNLEGD